MKYDPQQIVRGVIKVASLPNVYFKFAEALKNPLTSNHDLESILSEDTAIAARILRITNSAMYGFPSRIDTISRAVTILGHRQLHDIILACSIVQAFRNIPQDIVDMESFWRHSIACAMTARILATFRREQNPEHFFAAGLLHDIGRLIMFMEIPKVSREILQRRDDTGELLYVIEKEVLGFDHATLGGLLIKNWKIPDSLANAVAWHHAPHRASTYGVEAGIIHLADIICHALWYSGSGERFVPPMDEAIWDKLQIPGGALPQALDQLVVQHTEVVRQILGE